MVAIEVKDLRKTFSGVCAVDHISFQVAKGEVFGFLGHNGAGKTTTVRMLNGILAPDCGAVSVMGLSPLENGPMKWPANRRSPLSHR